MNKNVQAGLLVSSVIKFALFVVGFVATSDAVRAHEIPTDVVIQINPQAAGAAPGISCARAA